MKCLIFDTEKSGLPPKNLGIENKKQLVWIVNNLGKNLFNSEIWDKHNIYKNQEEEYPNSIDGILQIINQLVSNTEEKHELIKYLFGESLNKLSNE